MPARILTRPIVVFLATALLHPVIAEAQTPPEPRPSPDASLTFEKDVRPILRKHCVECHKPDNLEDATLSGQLALDSFAAVQKGVVGKEPHPVVVPGNSAESPMIARLLEDDEGRRMPLNADPLPQDQIESIRRWIDQGAKQGVAVESSTAAPRPRRNVRVVDVTLGVGVKPPDDLLPEITERELRVAAAIGPLSPITALAYSPDGKRLVVGRYGKLSIWDTATGEVVAQVMTGLAGAVHDVAFGPDGRLLAIAGGLPARQGQILLADAVTGSVVAELSEHRDVVFSVAFSPDGTRLASGSFDKTVALWNLETRALIARIDAHSDFVYDVAFSPDGSLLASASKDRTVKISDGTNGQSRRTLSGHENDVLAVVFGADGKSVVSSGLEPALRWWSLEDGSTLRQVGGHGGGVHELALSADGKSVVSASADRTLRLWDVGSGALQKTFSGSDEWMYSVALRPDGKHVVGGTWNGLVKLWDVESGQALATFMEPPPRITQTAEFLVLTSSGYYRASVGMASLLRWQLGGHVLSDESFPEKLHDSVMVGRVLGGQPVQPVSLAK